MGTSTARSASLTTSEVAARFDIARNTVLQRVANGKLTPVGQLPGRTGAYLFDAEQIEYLATHGPGTPRGGAPCGCPDDRCIGSHHDADVECPCNRVLNAEDAAPTTTKEGAAS